MASTYVKIVLIDSEEEIQLPAELLCRRSSHVRKAVKDEAGRWTYPLKAFSNAPAATVRVGDTSSTTWNLYQMHIMGGKREEFDALAMPGKHKIQQLIEVLTLACFLEDKSTEKAVLQSLSSVLDQMAPSLKTTGDAKFGAELKASTDRYLAVAVKGMTDGNRILALKMLVHIANVNKNLKDEAERTALQAKISEQKRALDRGNQDLEQAQAAVAALTTTVNELSGLAKAYEERGDEIGRLQCELVADEVKYTDDYEAMQAKLTARIEELEASRSAVTAGGASGGSSANTSTHSGGDGVGEEDALHRVASGERSSGTKRRRTSEVDGLFGGSRGDAA